MIFLRVGAEALSVPGKMELDEMAFLAALAAQVPKGGRIVEVGPFYGRSTRVMAEANPGAQITSIDTFEDAPWTRRYAARHSGIPRFGPEAFARYTGDLPNVAALQGPSPEAAKGWDAPIDLYFEDAVHGNPLLAENIAFWTGHLKPGGIACGHDYTLRFPDIKREVDAHAAAWGTEVALVGSLWALRKPAPGDAAARQRQPLTPALSDMPGLTLHAKTKRRGLHKAPAGYWCGAHLEPDRMLWFQVTAPDLPEGVTLEARVGHPDHGTGPWTQAGAPVRLLDEAGRPRAFDRVALRLSGPGAAGLTLGYRVSARQIGGGGLARSGTSGWAYDGAWAAAVGAGLALNALTAALLDAPILDAQAAFPPRAPMARGRKVLRRLAARAPALAWAGLS